MPELPEVQTVVNTLTPKAMGAAIIRVDVVRQGYLNPKGFPISKRLFGRVITSITRRGKRIIVAMDDGNRFLIHLGMTGRVTLAGVGAERAIHTHVVFTMRNLADAFEVHLCDPRRFGEVLWLGDRPGDEGLGIEPLGMTPRQLGELLRGSRRPMKAFLLDQTKIAGLGNIYVDESLFAAGIHPQTPANALSASQVGRLTKAIKRVLNKALRHRGSTLRDYVDADGSKGGFQRLHQVYGREGEACRNCRNTVQRIVLAGRSTCFCPQCQCLPIK